MKEKNNDKKAYNFIKRIIDVVLSLVALTVLFIPLAIIATIIKLTSKGPALFAQDRCGKDKKPFKIYKFRTMSIEAPSYVATRDLKITPDQTVPLGNFLRKTSIDEFPQFINILKGDMSLVGPRPVINQEGDLIHEREKYNANSLLPGLTGWAQINGRDDVGAVEKAQMDGFYYQNRTLMFDLKILLLTAVKVFKKEGIMEVSNHIMVSEEIKPLNESGCVIANSSKDILD